MKRMVARRVAIACAGTTTLAVAGCGGSEPEPAQTVQQLMAEGVQPTADIYWQSVQYISDEEGEHDIKPETEADWLATRNAAASLVEYGNQLMTPAYAEGRGEAWLDFARGMVEVGTQAEQAAVDRDPDAVFEVGGTLYNVCSSCHLLYPPANSPLAEEAAAGQ